MSYFQTLLSPLLDLNTLQGLKIVCNGDSIIDGTGADLPISVNGWFPQLCTQLDAICINQGASSKTLQFCTPTYTAYSFVTYDIDSVPDYDSTYGLYIIALGINDSALNDPSVFTYSNFKDVLLSVIDDIVLKGWPKKRILISSPTYINQAGLNSYVGIGNVTTANNLDGVQLYRDACLEVAEIKNTLYWDLSKPVIDLEDKDTYLSDNIHPNMKYHTLIPKYIRSLNLTQQ